MLLIIIGYHLVKQNERMIKVCKYLKATQKKAKKPVVSNKTEADLVKLQKTLNQIIEYQRAKQSDTDEEIDINDYIDEDDDDDLLKFVN